MSVAFLESVVMALCRLRLYRGCNGPQDREDHKPREGREGSAEDF
jgi:hypothetical protein